MSITIDRAIAILKRWEKCLEQPNCKKTLPEDIEYLAPCVLNITRGGMQGLRQYTKIGTIRTCRLAVEKTIPKQPYATGTDELDSYLCPNCGAEICCLDTCVDLRANYCDNCGQALEWDLTDEKDIEQSTKKEENMTLYKVPCEWMMTGYAYVYAKSKEEAAEIAEALDTPMPKGSFIDDSFAAGPLDLIEVIEEKKDV